MKTLLFPGAVVLSVVASMIWPAAFDRWGGVDLRVLIVPLIQVIMFGMGTTLSVADFTRVLRAPVPVAVGFVLQYTVMPCVGWLVAVGMGFEPEVASGIILVGSVAGGVASNLITYLAGGDVALSVTMTACSTVASPVMTPLWMKVLAGRMVPVDATAMMGDILNMILVPLVAGLIANRMLYGGAPAWRRGGPLLGVAALAAGVVVGCALWTPAMASAIAARNGLMLGAVLMAAVALARWILTVRLKWPGNWMDAVLTWVSMAGICLILAIITARAREKLIEVGALLIVAAAVHNGLGYVLGYWGARVARLNERQCRTVAIEVGMQNSGMAAGLAMTAMQSANAGLAPAVFGPLMNLSGAFLAAWWKRRPVTESELTRDVPSR